MNKTIKSYPDIDIQHEDAKVVNEEKEKSSFSLDKRVVRDLEECWMEIRKLSGSKRVSKTLLIEVSFLLAFCEFKNKKVDSDFYKEILLMIEEGKK